MLGRCFSILSLSVCSLVTFLDASEDLMQQEIKHVVVLMLENRSFDNVLAWLYNDKDVPRHYLPQTTDPHFLGLSEDTLSRYTNTLKDPAGDIVYSSPPIKGLPSVANTLYLNSPSTNPNEPFAYVKNQIFGFDGGSEPTMSGFLQDYANMWEPDTWEYDKADICAVMETYTENELPVLYGLAKQYAVSDLWFSSVPSQTNPNRAFMACGTSEGQIDNGPAGQSLFHADTIWNRLYEESPETTWTIFWQSDTIPEIVKGPYTSTNTFASLGRIPYLRHHYKKMDAFHDLARKGQLPDFSFIEPQWTLTENLAPKNFLIKVFGADHDLLQGLQGNDFHPPGDMRTGEDLLANIYTSLIANPEAWKKTLLIVTFDEHGGLFDHVPPPAAISPDDHFENGFKFDRYGVRVPTLFISPKIAKSTVIRGDHGPIPFDHTSLIATILKWKKIDKAKWKMGKRVESAPTFESIITLRDGREDTVLKPDWVVLPASDRANVVRMGDRFYLRDKNGEYLTHSKFLFKSDVRLGMTQDRVTLSFFGGKGTVTHGSFIMLQSLEQSLGSANIIGTSLFRSDCIYTTHTHDPGQWWTIKSLNTPYVGAEIHYGDPVYIENHIYLDPCNFVPSRITKDESIFGEFIKTSAITEENSEDNYWFLEKADLAPFLPHKI